MRLDVRIDTEARFYRCYLAGADISNDCFAADEEEGWADCYMRPLVREGDIIKTQRLYGEVKLVKMTPADCPSLRIDV